MRVLALAGVIGFVTVLATGCGGVAVNTSAPNSAADSMLSSGKIAAVQVTVNTTMNADRVALLSKNNVAALMTDSMTRALTDAGHIATDGPYRLHVTIEDFAIPNWGPAWVNLLATVNAADGAPVKNFGAKSSSMRGGNRAKRMTRILSDAAQKILNGL